MGGQLCSFCGSEPAVATSVTGDVACCGPCGAPCGAPRGALDKLVADVRKARQPAWNRKDDQDEDRNTLARKVGLTDDEPSAEMLSLIVRLEPHDIEARSRLLETSMRQAELTRRRAPASRRAVTLSALDALAARQGQMPPSAIPGLMRRAGLKV
jgi:Zn-finger nucleic acid-binding protein